MGQLRLSNIAYGSVAMFLAGMVILPWHLWQYALHERPFFREYVGVNLTGRLFHAIEGHTGGLLDYLESLRQGLSIWGYLYPLAYIWAVRKAWAQGKRRTWLLLAWITLSLVLFSMAQTKLD
jgi:4-amino-4-deoxy-L-arabinose transferase-like glycosyltransferase